MSMQQPTAFGIGIVMADLDDLHEQRCSSDGGPLEVARSIAMQSRSRGGKNKCPNSKSWQGACPTDSVAGLAICKTRCGGLRHAAS